MSFMGLKKWILLLIIFVNLLVFLFVLNLSIFKLQYKSFRFSNQTNLVDKFLRTIDTYNRKEIQNMATPQQNTVNEKPTLEYEQLRRRIYTNTQEMWNYVQSEVNKIQIAIKSLYPDLNLNIDNMLMMVAEHKRSLLNDIELLRQMDGFESWRRKESAELSELVQKRLTALQNPKNCTTAQKLVCRLNDKCGYGCQIHHIVYCLIMSYATERTLILKSEDWQYHKGNWDEVYEPLSKTCLTSDGHSYSKWPGNENVQVIELPIITHLKPKPKFLSLAVPQDLAQRLKRLHGDPFVWWVGQFFKYILRAQPDTQNMLEAGRKKMGSKRPIVGVHVRRTDKLAKEASLYTIEEYMKKVEDYFLQLEMTRFIAKRRVYLASDEPKVIIEARKKYPNYEFIADLDVARMAAVSTRNTDISLNEIILDIHLLSLCDYLVCTFSSNVCRMAYEIMQSIHPDASSYIKSLDYIYNYPGQNGEVRKAVLAHYPKNNEEILMNVGDFIAVAGNHWDGYSKGKNIRTNQTGLFPSFKVIGSIKTADFPKYSNGK